jgi:pseudaminic acid synthase
MEICIGNRLIGDSHPAFIVAELSANHLKNFDLAVKIIKEVAASGADAIKLQTYTPDTMTIRCDNEYFRIQQGTIWDGKTFYDLYDEAYTPWEWHGDLKIIAEREGLIFFSTAFDKKSVDFLESLEVPAYKVASFEITDIPLIEYIAAKMKPVIMSTGIATIADIQEALTACRKMGNNQIILLKCTSSYPTPLDKVNLRTIQDMAERFQVIPGLSDHTLGISVPIGAVVLGARLVEKHVTLDRSLGGPDSAFSLEPHEFRDMVNGIREIEMALGEVSYELDANIVKSRELSRSLFVVKDMKKGDKFTEENVRSIRPGFGMSPKYYLNVLGKCARIGIKKGTPLKWEMVDN